MELIRDTRSSRVYLLKDYQFENMAVEVNMEAYDCASVFVRNGFHRGNRLQVIKAVWEEMKIKGYCPDIVCLKDCKDAVNCAISKLDREWDMEEYAKLQAQRANAEYEYQQEAEKW